MERKMFLGQNLIWVMLLLGQLHGYRSCIQEERMALLELKKYFNSYNQEGRFENPLPTWTNDTKSNCCGWEGIKCNRTSRRVTKIASGAFYLGPLPLNLSLLHPFEEVQSLDLSGHGFIGLFDDMEGYRSLSRLTKLKILDLSVNEFNNSIFPFIDAAKSLTTLFLAYNYMYGPFPVKDSLKNLTNLEVLDLSGNQYNSSMPEFSHLKKLKALYLSYNFFSSSMELQELKYLTNLEVLSLDWNELHGPGQIKVLCEMKNLRELYLQKNYFAGQLPLCLGSLNKLQLLDLSFNQLSETLPSSLKSLESLEYLLLSDNNFEGFFSLSPVANLTKLKVLELSSTSDMLQVETESIWKPKFQLRVAVLPSCSLKKIPDFLMYQKKLRLVDLSSNSISGDIPTWLLKNNPELKVLQFKNNSFTIFQIPTIVHKLQVLDISANEISGVLPENIGHVLPNLVHMNASDNRFQGSFPSSVGEMKKISYLDLSHNHFSGQLPRSIFIGCVSLRILQLSDNKFSGHMLPVQTRLTSLVILRMDNNLFTGKIGVGLLTLVNLNVLDMSNNLLTGGIPSWIPDSSHLIMLLLSNNLLEGTLPPSLLAIYHLNFLDLSGNLLSGDLPTHVNSMYGIKLFLRNNSFTGPIPGTLLENVKILDLRNNKLSGSIPHFVNTLAMRIFLLKGNNLTGSIPRKLCDMSSIRLLDLSDNKLTGIIPSCLYNLSTVLGEEEEMSGSSVAFGFASGLQLEYYRSAFSVHEFSVDYYTYMNVKIQFAAKQRYDSYTGASKFSGGTLDYMYGLDLSSNELSGAIPPELGDLMKLRAMNLSRNFLSGSIPDSFSKLEDIESLDLSYNMLQGSIPHQLTNLTSLAVFNVSYNNLSGIIPQGRQFNTFNENSYLGNLLLCGPPTNRSCEAKKSSEEADTEGEEDDDEAVIDMLVFYWSSVSTYVTVLIGILLLMCVNCPWHRAWLRLVDAFIASVKTMLS